LADLADYFQKGCVTHPVLQLPLISKHPGETEYARLRVHEEVGRVVGLHQWILRLVLKATNIPQPYCQLSHIYSRTSFMTTLSIWRKWWFVV